MCLLLNSHYSSIFLQRAGTAVLAARSTV